VIALDWLLGCFGGDPGGVTGAYARFIGDDDGRALDELRGQVYLGSVDFISRLRPRASSREIPRAQREPVRRALDRLLSSGSGAEIVTAHREHGYALIEIARHLGVHYATVGRRLRAWEEGRPMSRRKT